MVTLLGKRQVLLHIDLLLKAKLTTEKNTNATSNYPLIPIVFMEIFLGGRSF